MVRLEDRVNATERTCFATQPVVRALADERRAQEIAAEKLARLSSVRLTFMQRMTAGVVAAAAVGSLVLQVIR